MIKAFAPELPSEAAPPSLSPIARDVQRGLSAPDKWLPSYLFYDREGSRLYEQITELPEYYPTRTEHAILQRHAADILERAAETSPPLPLHVIELGAGTATKTELLLRALVERQSQGLYLPIDVSPTPLAEARARLQRSLPSLEVRPFVGHHEQALDTIARLGPRRLALFLGSSIGNYEDDAAIALLASLRSALSDGDALLLGTDLRKSPSRLIPAYDDSSGVTAAFNKNILVRLNRELGAEFDPDAFFHVAFWNDQASRIEMHLESLVDQRVPIEALGMHITLRAGERIHTESSIKYDTPRIEQLLQHAGFSLEHTYLDDERLFAVNLARVLPTSRDLLVSS